MKIIGCMSGTSLDGLDLICVDFETLGGKINFDIQASELFPYTPEILQPLKLADKCSALKFIELERDLSLFYADSIRCFIEKHQIESVDYVASHGQTIFHQPEKGFTYQMGNGLLMAQQLQIPVVYDFRSLDVFYGGQGAPLVPIGDKLLFSDYDYCLNLGGFSNLSFQKGDERVAFDICPVNIVINELSRKLGKPYDESGLLAQKGHVIPNLLDQLNALEYYAQTFPKSLGKEWVDKHIFPLISSELDIYDVLRTFYEHITYQIGSVLKKPSSETLVTGGGAYNLFLMERMRCYSESKIIIPDHQIIDFKEALIFALLAYLRVRNEVNILSSVTGASQDSSSGLIAYP